MEPENSTGCRPDRIVFSDCKYSLKDSEWFLERAVFESGESNKPVQEGPIRNVQGSLPWGSSLTLGEHPGCSLGAEVWSGKDDVFLGGSRL